MAIKVGLILYSVRDEMAKDPIATVQKVGEMGYKFIETCNHNAAEDSGCGFGVPAETLKETFDSFGSKAVSMHIYPVESANLKEVVAYNKVLGNRNIVNPMAHFPTYDETMRFIEQLNETGKYLHEEGMTYLYHNHQQEFKTFKGKTIEELMMENTDPDYLSFELDTFWVMRAGLDPVETLKHMGSRVKLVHQKDFAWDSIHPINLIGLTPEEREMKPGDEDRLRGGFTEEERAAFWEARKTSFTEIGSGIMNIQAIIDAANEYTEAEYIILEQDWTRMPTQFDSIAKSMEGFRKFTGIEWA